MEFTGAMPAGGTTGRSLVLFEEDAHEAGVQAVQDAIAAAPGPEAAVPPQIDVYAGLGVAVVDAPPETVGAAMGDRAVLAVEPERIVYALEVAPAPPAVGNGHASLPGSAPQGAAPPPAPGGGLSADYLRGYRDAVDHLTEIGVTPPPGEPAPPSDEAQATWGLQATRVVNSAFSGKGVRVAVLDTGFALDHPDFAGRNVTTQSFVDGQEVQDGNGHGTHCIGTAMGPKAPATMPRYGIAYEAEIFAGKVLSNQGSGGDKGILAGIEWAIKNGCAVISMSLGAPVQPGEKYSQVYERVARRALQAGTLIVAAAGNESHRPDSVAPVGHPANCPSILAVAALDSALAVAWFSSRGVNPDGGQVDIAGPGVDVYSSWPLPKRYNTISGTSMATPHAAGIAALLAQANPTSRGSALGQLLVATAKRLELSSADVGSGLVQAP